MSSHLSNGVPLLFPIFLSFCKAPSQRLKFLKIDHAHECDFLISSWFLWLQGNMAYCLFYFCLDQRVHSHYDPANVHSLTSTPLCSTFLFSLTVFYSLPMDPDPYWIILWWPFHERIHSKPLFSQFAFLMKIPYLIKFLYLRCFLTFSMCFPHLGLPCLPWQDDLVQRTFRKLNSLPQQCS